MTAGSRIGLIVPSSNTTIETEVPEMLGRLAPKKEFTFHASRARMRNVSAEELSLMNAEAERCALELSDADVDVIVYACLIALISQGPDFPDRAAADIAAVAAGNGAEVPVVTSAGALVEGIRRLGASSVAIVTPYAPSLTRTLIDHLDDCGIRVTDAISLEEPDNRRVAQLDPAALPEVAERLDIGGADAIVLSACVQMRSLASIEAVQHQTGLPVLSAATATTHAILEALDVPPRVPGAGALLSAVPEPA
jgi:maleate isomerase